MDERGLNDQECVKTIQALYKEIYMKYTRYIPEIYLNYTRTIQEFYRIQTGNIPELNKKYDIS